MVDGKLNNRLEFLAKKFDIFETDEVSVGEKVLSLTTDGFDVKKYCDNDGTILAIESKKVTGNRSTRNISVSIDVFSDMLSADPTSNKSCTQWMLTVFVRFLKLGDERSILSAIRFVVEDLPQANFYLNIFESNKRKERFKRLCRGSYILLDVEDPTDLNQYKSLSQLFDAIDPFIEKNPSELERLLNRFVAIGSAEIPVRDRKYTVYIPKTIEASVVFNSFVSWCTAIPSNGNFKSYRNYLKPNGQLSDLFIVINNLFFKDESKELYQIHFESNQIKNRSNQETDDFFDNVLSNSEGVSNFFYHELMKLAKLSKKPIDSNVYVDFLIRFGFSDVLFNILDEDTDTIKFINSRQIPKLPDLSKFKSLEHLVIVGAGLVEVHDSIFKLPNLEILVLTNNKLTEIPEGIGELKTLSFLNISGNKIKTIPDEIKYLDRTNGGTLLRIVMKKDEIGESNYKKLKSLLPSTIIG